MVVLPDGASCANMEFSQNENSKNCIDFEEIINQLLSNPDVTFSNQHRGDNELTIDAKRSLAIQLLSANPNNFLLRFGSHLQQKQLNCFLELCNGTDKGIELKNTLDTLTLELDNEKRTRQRKNRRYQALQELIAANSYFSESEMMKRSPLLYNELVGQYLTEEERRLRDKANLQESLVQILMEGIERDDARELLKQQAEMEDNAMEEEDTSSDEEDDKRKDSDDRNSMNNARKFNESPEPEACHSRWGECEELADKRINKEEFYAKFTSAVEISATQKELLREEFRSLMYQRFLDGRDDFDYDTVDNNERYDNLDILSQDEEDKYFDSEEANAMEDEENQDNSGVSSEDELERFMATLHRSHPAVVQLSSDFEKL